MTRLFGSDQAFSLQTSIADALDSSSESLVLSQYPEVVEGYKTVYDIIANRILTSDVAVVEILLSTNSPGRISVQAAIQHPLRYTFFRSKTSTPKLMMVIAKDAYTLIVHPYSTLPSSIPIISPTQQVHQCSCEVLSRR
jgi:hypothetical protein